MKVYIKVHKINMIRWLGYVVMEVCWAEVEHRGNEDSGGGVHWGLFIL